LDVLTSRSAALLSNGTRIVGVAQVVVLAGEQAPGKGVIVDGIPVLRVPSWPRRRDYTSPPGLRL
jgi:hypothetical protein